MKKLFTLLAGALLFSISAHAGVTPYKNLYTVAEVYPTGAGEIYLAAKNEAQQAYVWEQSEDYGQNVFIQETIGENGTNDQYNTREGYEMDASGSLSNYEEGLYIEPAPGYEFVCVTNAIQSTGVYYPDICYQSHTGTGTDNFVFSWDYSTTDINLINVNSAARAEDGNSGDDSIGQDGVFALDNWDAEPNTHLYVIFRKVGDESPIFDKDYSPNVSGDVNGDGIVNEDDATAIADFRLGKVSIMEKYADVNGDGVINIADAVKIITELQK